MTQQTRKATWYVLPASIGLVLGMVLHLSAVLTRDQSPPEDDPTVPGVVHRKLGSPCGLVDDALLTRLYGKGAASDEHTYDRDTDTDCQWVAAPVYVRVHAELEDYPEGGEVGNAADAFARDRREAEESDPATGLPERVPGLGDEAYLVYDSKRRRRDEENVWTYVRRGNVLLTIELRRSAEASRAGHGRMARDARRIAAAAVRRLPRP